MKNTARQNMVWYICLWLAAFGTTLIVIPDLLLHPGNILLQLGGDGIKNFYSYYYHVMYDKGFHFTGMNYPTGEHIVYADGQAFLSVPLSWLRQYIPFTPVQVITIMHLVIVAGYMLAIVYIGLLLRFFKTSGWFSIVFAVLIVLLSPQVFRIFGHYGLSYFCVIPMLFYWTVKYHYTGFKRYALYIFLLGAIMAFAHPYFAAVFFIWGVLYMLAYIITRRQAFRNTVIHILPYTVAIISIPALLKLVMAFTDHVTDRPAEPFGTLSACTRVMNVLTCRYSALWRVLDEVFKIKSISGIEEGLTYIGIPSFTIVTCSAIYVLSRLLKRRKEQLVIVCESVFSPVWLIIAFGALLLAMGIPFVWHMEWLLDYLSVFRQFRSLGRFSWIFYYVVTIYASVVLYHWFRAKTLAGRKGMAWAVLVLCVGLWVFEISGYVLYASKMQGHTAAFQYEWFFSKKEKNWQQFLAANQYEKQDFQAIMLYPYMHIGTEKLWLEGDNLWVFTVGASAASQLHLPIVNVIMSRSSWSQAFENVKMAGGLLAGKSYLNKVSDKPFLLVRIPAKEIKPGAQYLFDASDYIGDFYGAGIYACYPSRIKAQRQALLASLQPIILAMHTGDTVVGTGGKYYIEHFDTGTSKQTLFNGAATPVKQDYANLPDIDITIAPDSETQHYEFSAWALLPSDSYRSVEFSLKVYDSARNQLQEVYARSKEATDFNGMWFRVSAGLILGKNTRHIQCRICNVPLPSYIALDELMIRPANATVISKSADGKVLVNNHLVNLQSPKP